MLTESLAPYMLWAKTRVPAEIDLAGSNLLPCSLEDLPGALDAVELTAANDNGFAPLVEAIAAHHRVSTDRVITGAGCSGANFLAIAALVGPGDDVLIEQPGYDPLVGACQLIGARVTRFPRPYSDRFQVDIDRVKAALTPATRLIIVTSPHNPSGVCLSQDTLEALRDVAVEAGAHLLVDQVYLDAVNLAAAPQSQPHAASAVPLEGPVITTNSLTKSYGLSGLRCGWAIAPPSTAERLFRVRDLVDVIGSAPSERLSAFAFSRLPDLAARTRQLLLDNLDVARRFVASSPRLELAEPPRATVMLPRLSGMDDSRDFVAQLATAHGVAVAPGYFFDTPAHFRISLAGRTDRLTEGLTRLAAALTSD